VFGGILEKVLGQPWSPARKSLIPIHVFAFGLVGILLGGLLGLAIRHLAGARGSVDRGADNLPTSPRPFTGQFRKDRRFAVLLAGVVLVAVVLVAVGGFYLFRSGGPLAKEPASCPELVKRLQDRGLEIDWVPKRSGILPGVFVFRGEAADRGGADNLINANAEIFDWIVTVVQYPTPEDAREVVEYRYTRNAFAYARFLIYGNAELVADIKNCLAGRPLSKGAVKKEGVGTEGEGGP
jgi:hypothetical protein